MSEMEGLQLQGRLAAVGVELPLIVVSAQADVATTVRAMTAGAVDFIEKPYEADRLVKPLNRRWRRPADQPFAGIKLSRGFSFSAQIEFPRRQAQARSGGPDLSDRSGLAGVN
jgi:DNA-binding response OmpR family regulator